MIFSSNISLTSGPNGLKFRYVVALEQSFSMSIKSKRSGGNLQYLPSYLNFNFKSTNIRDKEFSNLNEIKINCSFFIKLSI
ncbi:hypothetical protein BCR32DRAFT_288664 [Anaeromyces robustus]|uniref:Uncharacterized protein n=1 Tax=Anaeromyces robustus TaxID=1754192 RepID=A0A1Y1U9W2_9FUNG|nr:hypothetical protein BCR32DRAFT_288664 [Anaeromyces robustus]|eukprot:ORX34334.1 hypothetical protein BCR32DRAFT_288664 [Anaeromyces robustus]